MAEKVVQDKLLYKIPQIIRLSLDRSTSGLHMWSAPLMVEARVGDYAEPMMLNATCAFQQMKYSPELMAGGLGQMAVSLYVPKAFEEKDMASSFHAAVHSFTLSDADYAFRQLSLNTAELTLTPGGGIPGGAAPGAGDTFLSTGRYANKAAGIVMDWCKGGPQFCDFVDVIALYGPSLVE